MDTNIRPFFSITIPCWGIEGRGVDYLEHSFNILSQQTFTNFNIVISDHSTDDCIKDLCEQWSVLLNIKYIRNDKGRGKIAPNLNVAINHSNGEYIKVLFQDDFLYDEYSLQKVADYIETNEVKWLVTGCAHTRDMENLFDVMVPRYNERIHEGFNTISCPSVLTIKNENPILFDESLNWLVDVDYYKKCYTAFGQPHILEDICIVNRDSDVRVTTATAEETKRTETLTLHNRYKRLHLEDVTIVSVAGIKAQEALNAIKYSCKDIDFGDRILITPEDISDSFVRVVKCTPLDYEQYNKFIVFELHKYIKTKYALVIQGDGFVLNATQWSDVFLNYDYIGAIWPLPSDNYSFRDSSGDLYRVGNGGFSLRSKKLLTLPTELGLEWKSYYGNYHEDGYISVHHRKALEEGGCLFAPIRVAAIFSHETPVPETEGIVPFGFHGKNTIYYETLKQFIL